MAATIPRVYKGAALLAESNYLMSSQNVTVVKHVTTNEVESSEYACKCLFHVLDSIATLIG